MRVNSDFTTLFNNRFGFASVLLAFFLIISSFADHPGSDLPKKQANLMIRQIGHRLLLQAGDSTSRVLPVTEIEEGTFLLSFENKFVFDHDSLIALSQDLLPKKQFPSGYTVTVHDCKEASIVYGFQVSNTASDILACQGRTQPEGCYTIEFTFPDFYEHAEQKNTKAEQLTEKLKSFEIGTPHANSKLEASETTTSSYPSINLVYVGVLMLVGVTIFIRRFGKNSTPVPVQDQDNTVIKESSPELTSLGEFSFDVKGQRLLLENEIISLTDKECKVLELLAKNFGELIPRETLMQEIWINEGVITGRSLDMFVSKLRKKLSRDPELRITNVHGKGYKLEKAETETL